MLLIVEVRGNGVWRRVDGKPLALPDPVVKGTVVPAVQGLEQWIERYARATASRSEAALRQIGEEMYAWLDQGQALTDWALSAEPALEVRAEAGRRDALTAALLAAPWELLARDGIFLAEDQMRLFAVARRCTAVGDPVRPAYCDLSLLFMAAAPDGQSTLNFEAEEAMILEATRAKTEYGGSGGVPLAHLTVEESGALELLAERNRLDGPFEALHLSCHGDIQVKDGAAPVPHLYLESPEGDPHPVPPTDLFGALEGRMPPLLFLSACRTAERGGSRASGGVPRAAGWRDIGRSDDTHRDGAAAGPAATLQPAEPYALSLAQRVANVLGWDGSVYDADATQFAETLYGALARGETVPRAAALARRALLKAPAASPGDRHWHLARVYLGPGGGGPLCAPGLPHRPARSGPEEAFLDPGQNRVRVATRREFVGRRRQIQKILAAYRDGRKGALIFGMGCLGKSSLAARVAARMPKHKLVLVHGAYHALAMFEQVAWVAQEIADGMDLAEASKLKSELDALRAMVLEREGALEEALRRLLRGVYKHHPVLLVIDDLEQALETPSPAKDIVEPKPNLRAALSAVLGAFAAVNSPSRLLVTSRYDVVMRDEGGTDRAAALVRVPLVPMRPEERTKQWRARTRGLEAETAQAPAGLIAAALAAAAGNPGLQDMLTRPLLDTGTKAAEAEAAVAAIQHYRATGQQAGTAAQAFFDRIKPETYAAALNPDQRRQLTAATLFSEDVPIPHAALAAAGAALGAEQAAVERLLALGMLDDWGQIGGKSHAAVNPLARPLAPPLGPADRFRLARAALPHLVTAWRDAEGDFPFDSRGVEATNIALEAGADPEIVEATALAGGAWLARDLEDNRAALALIRRALEALPTGFAAGPGFLRMGLECANLLGDAKVLNRLFSIPVRPATAATAASHAAFDLRRAEHLIQTGKIAEAEQLTRTALAAFQTTGDDRMTAMAFGQIADILSSRGELDEALRIRREEQLPVYDRLGDVRSRAVTMGKIADILQARGEIDEALRIRREEQLPVYDRLGDVREHAVTLGKIADILSDRGEIDEALRIRREEELPVYDRLGDVRSRAVTMGKIADILSSRGKIDVALRIHREEQLPVYDRLGDVRSRAVTMGKIADILQARGELDEALRIRREEVLPVFDRLGDARSRAVALGKIADILQARGELDEALRIRREEELPVYDRLGDVRERSVVLSKIAGALIEAGGLQQDRAQEIFDALTEAFAIAQGLRLAGVIANAGALLAHLLAIHGQPSLALDVLKHASIAFNMLGDTKGAADVEKLRAAIRSKGQ
jgi:tetratricopeptide (TPR) repeat protein